MFKKGLTQSLPIAMAYLAISFAYGVTAANLGISLFATLLMSVVVYAGSAQMIAISLIAAGLPTMAIVSTVFVVNLRNFLLCSALAPYLKSWSLWRKMCFALQVTDETFALHSANFAAKDVSKDNAFALNIVSHLAWITGGCLGYISKSGVDIKGLGLDYALCAMFIALIILQTKNKIMAFVAFASGCVALWITSIGGESFGIVVTTIYGATLGMGMEKWIKRKS